MSKRLLAVFAHPDDEAFGPGGTLAYYAKKGVEVHLLSATRGEAGDNKNFKFQIFPPQRDPRCCNYSSDKIRIASSIGTNFKNIKKKHLGLIREKELLRSAKILGIDKVEFLDFIDGQLCNAIYHQLADKIINKINKFKPQVIMTVERRGISGHLDHIAVSMITTYAYLKTNIPQKLYYHCLPKEMRDGMMDNYFVYFPEGYCEEEITSKIDIACCWDKKVKAMMVHKSQFKDVKNLLSRFHKWPQVDHFILQYHRGVKVKLPETDLFAGIK